MDQNISYQGAELSGKNEAVGKTILHLPLLPYEQHLVKNVLMTSAPIISKIGLEGTCVRK